MQNKQGGGGEASQWKEPRLWQSLAPRIAQEGWEWSLNGLGVGEEASSCAGVWVLALCPLLSFHTTTDRYTEYLGEFTNKSLLQGKWHHGLHNMFRQDSFRSVHAFF